MHKRSRKDKKLSKKKTPLNRKHIKKIQKKIKQKAIQNANHSRKDKRIEQMYLKMQQKTTKLNKAQQKKRKIPGNT